MNKRAQFIIITLVAVLALAVSGALANTREYVNEAVTVATAQGNFTSGTAGDSVLNIFDAYSGTFYNGTATTFANSGYSYIDLIVRNGTNMGFGNLSIGISQTWGGNYQGDSFDTMTVMGASTVTASGFSLGIYSNNNSLVVKEGSLLTTPTLYVQASNNTITIDNATILTTNTAGNICVGFAAGETGNQMIVQNGGVILAGYTTGGADAGGRLGVGRFGNDNTLTVTGKGSRAFVSGQFRLSEGSTGYHNGLILENGGVLKAASIGSTALVASGADYIQFKGGYLALVGSSASVSSAVVMTAWDGDSWDATITSLYCADVAAVQAFMGSNYTDDMSALAGYTIWTGGVPEPTTMAMLAIGGIGVLVRRRRK